MTKQINVDISVVMTGVQPIQLPTFSLQADALEQLKVEIPKSASKDIEVQPTSDPAKVKFLLIKADSYDGQVKYKIDGGSKEVKLDGPLILSGSGAVGILEKIPTKLTVTNDSTTGVAVIEIFVGRSAT